MGGPKHAEKRRKQGEGDERMAKELYTDMLDGETTAEADGGLWSWRGMAPDGIVWY